MNSTIALAAAAAQRQDAAEQTPGDARHHDQHAEADEADADDRGRAVLRVDGVRDGDRDCSDQHEPDSDGDGDQRTDVRPQHVSTPAHRAARLCTLLPTPGTHNAHNRFPIISSITSCTGGRHNMPPPPAS